MCATPLAVDVDAEAAVWLLPGEEGTHRLPIQHPSRLRRILFAKQVAFRLEDDPRLIRLEQPVDRAHVDVSSVASMSSSSPSRQTPSASSQYSRMTPTRLKPAFS